MAELWPKNGCSFEIIGIFRDFLAYNLAKYQYLNFPENGAKFEIQKSGPHNSCQL